MWLAEGHTPPYFEFVLLWRLSTVKSFASKNKYNIWSSSSVACKNAELGLLIGMRVGRYQLLIWSCDGILWKFSSQCPVTPKPNKYQANDEPYDL